MSTRNDIRKDEQTDVCACPVCFTNECLLANRDNPNLDRFLDDLEPKTKCLQLDYYAPIFTSPIKSTRTQYLCNEEVHKSKPGRTAAVVARPYFRGQNGLSSNRRHVVSTCRVLLDSGTDGDLLFQEKYIRSKNMSIPYVTRAIPRSWHTYHGIFRTEERGE